MNSTLRASKKIKRWIWAKNQLVDSVCALLWDHIESMYIASKIETELFIVAITVGLLQH